VHVLGSIYVILGVAMASIHFSLALFNVVRERLPTRPQSVVTLPQRRGKLIFHPRGKPSGSPRIGLTYLGLVESHGHAPQPRFHLDIQSSGNIYQMDMATVDRWEDTALLDRFPALREQRIRLTLEVLDASQESVRLRVDSPMTLTYEGEWDATGLHLADVLALPDSLRHLINWMMRQGEVSLTEAMAQIGQEEEVVRTLLEDLVEQGLMRQTGVGREARYRAQLAFRRGHQLPEDIWQALEKEAEDSRRWPEPVEGSKAGGPGFSTSRFSILTRLGERGRFLLSASPVIMVFLLAEVLLFTGRESFPEPLSLIGVIVVSLLAGIFPVLLLVSSRRKGEFMPEVVYRLLGHPLLTIGIYSIFLASIFLHGLVIWQGPVERAGALFVGISMLGVTVAMARRGAFAPRVIVELREDPSTGSGQALGEEGRSVFAITAGGQPATAEVRLGYPEGERRYQAATGEVPTPSSLRYAIFQVPTGQAQELKVWAHKITSEGDSMSPYPHCWKCTAAMRQHGLT